MRPLCLSPSRRPTSEPPTTHTYLPAHKATGRPRQLRWFGIIGAAVPTRGAGSHLKPPLHEGSRGRQLSEPTSPFLPSTVVEGVYGPVPLTKALRTGNEVSGYRTEDLEGAMGPRRRGAWCPLASLHATPSESSCLAACNPCSAAFDHTPDPSPGAHRASRLGGRYSTPSGHPRNLTISPHCHCKACSG